MILVVDSDNDLKRALEAVYEGGVLEVNSAVDARRRLLQDSPEVVVLSSALKSEPGAGVRLVKEMRSHPSFAQLPTLVVATSREFVSVREDLADVLGTTVIKLPISSEELCVGLKAICPKVRLKSASAINHAPKSNPSGIATRPSGGVSTGPELATGSDDDKKLRKAQLLLASVLHNLKTSDLLRVADLEDVPRIVFEITRSVCGISDRVDNPSKPQEGETSLNLDDIFGKKG